MADQHKNFAYSTVATAPVPSRYGTSLVVASGEGARFPDPPFMATIWPAGEQATSTNAEIVRVTAVSTDTFTMERAQTDSYSRNVLVGDQISAGLTARVMTDAENVAQTWSPFVLASATAAGAFQTLHANYTSQTGTGSIVVFPVTVQKNVEFNMIFMINSLSYVTSNQTNTIRATHYSKFGFYSLNGNTLSLLASNSFSLAYTNQSVSMTFLHPNTTHTTGYGYDNLTVTGTAEISSFISGTRGIAMQFGKNFHIADGQYWIALLALKSTAGSSTFGFSNVGVAGQIMNPVNMPGTVSGYTPLGLAASGWSASNSHSSAWYGLHMGGIVTATSITNFLGTAIPPAITLSAIGGVAASHTISVLPSVTFVST
jgi:hypothetical protein